MLRVSVTISNISAERFFDFRKPFHQVHINTNLNLTGTERKPDESLDVPFVLTISCNPLSSSDKPERNGVRGW
jgi:hypothetical protein